MSVVQKGYTLRVDLADWDGSTAYAEYSSFSVASAADKYRLSVSGYSGTAGDGITRPDNDGRYSSDGAMFTTQDQDNDGNGNICATLLSVSGYSGTAGDGITSPDNNGRYNANGAMFTTQDQDNDGNGNNCAT
ncbi:angiopoietin-4-like [Branchiostoma floridae]|uniref:Angiopoietin-4-like n=1 Tax=Branchiostoma floridae TaxID=7739 RepID=A0A9J7N095_BRAFL|nr:angiopoietin-4-like [Branchiostoma floridae]